MTDPDGSFQDRFLGHPSDAQENRYVVFADMADAYVSSTLETICRIDATTTQSGDDPVMARRMAVLRAKLDGLDELIVRLRELQAEAAIEFRARAASAT